MALSRAALVLLLCPAAAWGQSGQEAFERQDYAAAVELWRAEAAEGSAEAKFGLGLVHDLGLGVPRSSAAALRWYLEAAGDGWADAQFNVAVMFDAGTGMPRDPAAAATWYARSAANGHARAQYNLGMLYENGIGVPRNAGLARTWYGAASGALAAAADRLAALPPAVEGPPGAPPQPVTGAVVGPPDAPRAELVWTAGGGGGAFRVEVARRTAGLPGRDDLLLSRDVERSAVVLDLPPGEAGLLWRVGRAGGAQAWSAWQDLSREAVADGPPAEEPAAEEPPLVAEAAVEAPSRLTIYVDAEDRLARSFAEELSETFSRGGLGVTIREAAGPAAATRVEYRHPGDAPLAAAIAEFLPGLRFDSPVQIADGGAAPGEVTLRLVGGPRPSGVPRD